MDLFYAWLAFMFHILSKPMGKIRIDIIEKSRCNSIDMIYCKQTHGGKCIYFCAGKKRIVVGVGTKPRVEIAMTLK